MDQEKRKSAPDIKSVLCRVFCGAGGKLRALWCALAIFVVCVAWQVFAGYVTELYFSILFAKLGVNSATVHRAPVWAQLLAENSGVIANLAVYCTTAVVALCLCRAFGLQKAADGKRGIGVGTLLGVLMAALPAALFLWTDSVRVDAYGTCNPGWVAAAALCAAACMAEELFCRSLAFRVIQSRAEHWAGYAVSCALTLVLQNGNITGWLSVINLVLTGVLCCCLYKRRGFGAAFAFRFMYAFVGAALLQFPGSGLVAQPAVKLYSVSEQLWTGGNAGMLSGAAYTVLTVLMLVFEQRSNLKAFARKAFSSICSGRK